MFIRKVVTGEGVYAFSCSQFGGGGSWRGYIIGRGFERAFTVIQFL